METPPKPKSFSLPSFATHATRGIIRDQRSRRRIMLATLAVALLMVAAGSTVLQDVLNPREHALRFIGYWLTCAWFTLTALLLALFEALIVRAQARAARDTLKQEFSGTGQPGVGSRDDPE